MFLQLSDSGVDVPVEFTSFINSKFNNNLNNFSKIYVLGDPDRKEDIVEIKNSFSSRNEGDTVCITEDEVSDQTILDWLSSL